MELYHETSHSEFNALFDSERLHDVKFVDAASEQIGVGHRALLARSPYWLEFFSRAGASPAASTRVLCDSASIAAAPGSNLTHAPGVILPLDFDLDLELPEKKDANRMQISSASAANSVQVVRILADRNAFRHTLRYLYTGRLELPDLRLVPQVLHLARLWELPLLVAALSKKVVSSSSSSRHHGSIVASRVPSSVLSALNLGTHGAAEGVYFVVTQPADAKVSEAQIEAAVNTHKRRVALYAQLQRDNKLASHQHEQPSTGSRKRSATEEMLGQGLLAKRAKSPSGAMRRGSGSSSSSSSSSDRFPASVVRIRVFKADPVVLAAKSSYFATMFSGFHELHAPYIRLFEMPGVEAHANLARKLSSILAFFYTGRLSLDRDLHAEIDAELESLAEAHGLSPESSSASSSSSSTSTSSTGPAAMQTDGLSVNVGSGATDSDDDVEMSESPALPGYSTPKSSTPRSLSHTHAGSPSRNYRSPPESPNRAAGDAKAFRFAHHSRNNSGAETPLFSTLSEPLRYGFDLIELAQVYGIASLSDAVAPAMLEKVTVENVCIVWNAAASNKYQAQALADMCKQFFQERFLSCVFGPLDHASSSSSSSSSSSTSSSSDSNNAEISMMTATDVNVMTHEAKPTPAHHPLFARMLGDRKLPFPFSMNNNNAPQPSPAPAFSFQSAATSWKPTSALPLMNQAPPGLQLQWKRGFLHLRQDLLKSALDPGTIAVDTQRMMYALNRWIEFNTEREFASESPQVTPPTPSRSLASPSSTQASVRAQSAAATNNNDRTRRIRDRMVQLKMQLMPPGTLFNVTNKQLLLGTRSIQQYALGT